jgi:bifunctional DNA-binding transcriptional regulator/antitoxin component of YhaV-PrlF toxin-antitoxin module
LVVLDSAGRLQVPKEYLEYFNISLRARLDITEDGILIRPAPEEAVKAAEKLVSRAPRAGQRKGAGGLSKVKDFLFGSKVGELFGGSHSGPGRGGEEG